MSTNSSVLSSKHLVLGVTGSISAYKSVYLLRELLRRRAEVTPVLTEDAKRFVGMLTFEALSGKRLAKDLWSGEEPLAHTVLSKSADALLIAPATATILAKAAAGIADDLLSAVILSTSAPVVMIPAMHTEMWENHATRHNVEVLRSRGVTVMEPSWGELAGFDEGPGRLPEIEDIVYLTELVVERANNAAFPFSTTPDKELDGIFAVVTAGGTREPIDAVRYVGNRSSGKMGHALAREAWLRGANVTLVTTVPLEAERLDQVKAETAPEMRDAALAAAPSADVVVMAAAVADFRPKEPVANKIKKEVGLDAVAFEPNPDILEELAQLRKKGELGTRLLVGFAAETGELDENARMKLERKDLDVIVANDVSRKGSGFGSETNEATIITRDGLTENLPLMPKAALARIIWDRLAVRLRDL